MSSTFSDLYSEYQDQLKVFVEKPDFTERMFMRQLTRGIQVFQRETKYVELYSEILPDSNGLFHIPDDTLVVVELADEDGIRFLQQDYMQYGRNVEKWPTMKLETPTDWTLRTELRMSGNGVDEFLRDCACRINEGDARLFAVWDRTIYVYPAKTFTKLHIRYIPNMEPYSRSSDQWNMTDSGGTPIGWFPEDRFDTMFRTTGVLPALAPYEDSFVDFALAKYVKAKGSANYKVYEASFWEGVERAKINKPIYFTEGVTDYFMAPWS